MTRQAAEASVGPVAAHDAAPEAFTACVRSHPLLAYVLLAYALSWAYWLPLVLTGHIVRLSSPATQFPALLGPLIAAFAVTAVTLGKPGVRDLAARVVRWRVPPRWWLFALVVIAAEQHRAKSWWRNFDAENQAVTVTVRGQRQAATARRLVSGDARKEALGTYQRRYPRVTLEADAPVLLLTPRLERVT